MSHKCVMHHISKAKKSIKRQDFTCSFLIKTSKCISDHILRVCAVELLSKHGEEHGEVNWPRSFVHHGLQIFISGIFSCLRKNAQHTYKLQNMFKNWLKVYKTNALTKKNLMCSGPCVLPSPIVQQFSASPGKYCADSKAATKECYRLAFQTFQLTIKAHLFI